MLSVSETLKQLTSLIKSKRKKLNAIGLNKMIRCMKIRLVNRITGSTMNLTSVLEQAQRKK